MDIFEHGKSLWKHDNAMLKDSEYLKIIWSKLWILKKIPCKFNHDYLKYIPDDEMQFAINDQLFFETLLIENKRKLISYSKYMKNQ